MIHVKTLSEIGIIQHLHDHWYIYENCEAKLLDNVKRNDAFFLFSSSWKSFRMENYLQIDFLVCLYSYSPVQQLALLFYFSNGWYSNMLYPIGDNDVGQVGFIYPK